MVVKPLLPTVPENAKSTREDWITAFNETAEKNNQMLKAMSVWKKPRPRLSYQLSHIQGFQRMKISELQAGETHEGHVLFVRVATEVMIQDAKSVLIEDESGICELAVYHLRKKKLKCGQFLAILEPFYKRRLDGTLRVEIDDPSDLVFEFDPPFAWLEGLARLFQDEAKKKDLECKVKGMPIVASAVHEAGDSSVVNKDEKQFLDGGKNDSENKVEDKEVDEPAESSALKDEKEIYFDVEAQRSEPIETSSGEEKKGDEDGQALVPLPEQDNVSVDYGNLDEDDDTILLVARPPPLGMPTICEGEDEDEGESSEAPSVDAHADELEDEEDNHVLNNETASAPNEGLELDDNGHAPQDISTIPIDDESSSSCEHIPLLVFAVNGLITNQKLLIEALLGKKTNQKK